jgi:hypothetical protein
VFEIGPQFLGYLLGMCGKVVVHLLGTPHAHHNAVSCTPVRRISRRGRAVAEVMVYAAIAEAAKRVSGSRRRPAGWNQW